MGDGEAVGAARSPPKPPTTVHPQILLCSVPCMPVPLHGVESLMACRVVQLLLWSETSCPWGWVSKGAFLPQRPAGAVGTPEAAAEGMMVNKPLGVASSCHCVVP